MTHEIINDNPHIELYCGDGLKVLKMIPDESIDCCITSPPYWALRDYQLEPQIWDGDRDCQHDFSVIHRRANDKSGGHGNKGFIEAEKAQDAARFGPPTDSCSKCNAWRGSLGLEPTFQLYLKHLWQIFDEIKRILKKTGTLWVNMGDTYHNATKWTNKDECPHTISKGNNRDFKTGRRIDQGLEKNPSAKSPPVSQSV